MSSFEFKCNLPFDVTAEVKDAFDQNGFIVVRQLLDKEEQDKLKFAAEKNEAFDQHAFNVDDSAGRQSRLVIWCHPGNDVTGILARSERIASTCEKLLGDEVYHYHGKLMMKNARTGGQFVWHQDYGYWYQNGNLFPDMMSVFIAIDPSTKDNGCLQVLQGSHLCGRLEHDRFGGQTGADPERVALLEKVCPRVYVELEPGDAVYFHANLLHTSTANTSNMRRWALILAINTKHNNPTRQHHHPQYRKLDIVADSALKKCENYYDMTGKDFMDPRDSKTIKSDDE